MKFSGVRIILELLRMVAAAITDSGGTTGLPRPPLESESKIDPYKYIKPPGTFIFAKNYDLVNKN
jgi:hypothetical protein